MSKRVLTPKGTANSNARGITRRTALSMAAGFAVAGATGGKANAQKRGGDFVMAQPQLPPSMDPIATAQQPSRNISMHLYETLVARSEAGKPIPDLAKTVDVSPDFKTFKFTLREGVKFHNGKEMTAEDAVASMKRYKDIGENYGSMDPVESITQTGKYTFEIKTSTPYPPFVEMLSTVRTPAVIVPSEEAAKPRGQITPIGTGPYRLAEYKADSHIKLARFEDYQQNTNYQKRDGFGGKKTPYFDTVTIRFLPEDGSRTSGLLTGEIHLNETMVSAGAERLKKNPAVKVVENSPWGGQMLRFNMSDPLLANVDFRRAIQAGLDHEEIMAISSDGLYTLDPGWVYPGLPYHSDAGKEKFNRNDKNLAKELLKKSGYAGQPLVFIVDPLKSNNQSAVIMQQQMRALGINVDLKVVDFPTATATAARADGGWHFWTHILGIEPYEGPYAVVGTFIGERLKHRTGNDPENQRFYKILTTSPDEAERQKAFQDFQRRMADQVFAIKLGNYGVYQAMRSNVEGFVPSRVPRLWDVWMT